MLYLPVVGVVTNNIAFIFKLIVNSRFIKNKKSYKWEYRLPLTKGEWALARGGLNTKFPVVGSSNAKGKKQGVP